MKLRNKKTGIIEYLLFNSVPVSGDIVLEYMDENSESGYSEYCRYKTLAELNEEWEDYKSPEPLIKDEKIRKMVRAWAEGYKIKVVQYDAFWNGLRSDNSTITLWKELPLVDHYDYSIDDLCGEEEE